MKQQSIIEQAKQVYGGEMFTQPEKAIKGTLWTDGEPKVYNMAYMQGQPHAIVESYQNEAVIVTYAVTGISYSWEWKDRNLAWKWAKERKQHIEGIKACYRHNYK